jgi:hypothetical protein
VAKITVRLELKAALWETFPRITVPKTAVMAMQGKSRA